MSSDCESGEIAPLRRNFNCAESNNNNNNNNNNTNNSNNNNSNINYNTYCDSITVSDSTTASGGSRLRGFRSQFNMSDSRKIIIKIVIDFLLLACVGFPILAFFIWGEPYKRGFFCNDESLMHPFHDSTVRNWMLYIVGLVVPIALIIVTEIIQAKLNKKEIIKHLQLFNWYVPHWLVQSYKQVGVFGFGAACSQLTTDIAKYTIGRLRPHFHSVCQPIMPDGTDCSNPANLHRYIEEFTCLGFGSDARMLKEMRLSFPSGHASFSAYTMIYCAIYLHARMKWRGSKLIKHFLQFLLISMTWYTSLSRISDYKHHWSDVLAGATLGAICAMVVANFVSDLFVNKNSEKLIPQTRYELGASTSNGAI